MKYVNAGNGKMPLISLIAILAISLTINMPGLAVSPMLAKLRDLFHASEVEAQLVTSLPNLCMIPVTLIAGRLSIAKWQTGVLVSGLSIFLVAGIACFFAQSIEALIIFGCLVGVGCGLVVPLAAGYISEWFMGRSRQSDLGLKSTTSNAMVVIANVYVGIIVAVNWRAAFAVYLTPIIPLILVPFLTNRFIKSHRRPETSPQAEVSEQPDPKAKPNTPFHFQGKQSLHLLISICLLYMFLTYATTSISYYAPFTMKAFGMNTVEVGVVTAMYYLMCSVAGTIVAKAKNIMGKNMMFICLGIIAIGLIVMGLTRNFWIYSIMSFFIGFAYGIIQPIIYNKTTYIAPDKKKGTLYFGYVLSVNYVAIMMVPFIDGFFRRLFHSHNPAFEFLFSGIVVVLILLWAWLERRSYVFAINPASPAPSPSEINLESTSGNTVHKVTTCGETTTVTTPSSTVVTTVSQPEEKGKFNTTQTPSTPNK